MSAPFNKRDYLTFTNIFALLGVLIYLVQWQTTTDNRINVLEVNQVEHIYDTNKHMPFKEKIEIFVPRTEISPRLERIENKLDKVLEHEKSN